MTYPELQKILDKEGIGTYIQNEYKYVGLDSDSNYGLLVPTEDIRYLYIIDAPLYLFPLKERIGSLLKLNYIKANVEVDEEKEVLTIKLENNV